MNLYIVTYWFVFVTGILFLFATVFSVLVFFLVFVGGRMVVLMDNKYEWILFHLFFGHDCCTITRAHTPNYIRKGSVEPPASNLPKGA